MKFIEAECGRTLLNLGNVTNVAFLDKQTRVVFNFNNNIEILAHGNTQTIADYRYDDYGHEDYNKNKLRIEQTLIDSGFISPLYQPSAHHWVNPKHITFVNTDYKKCRLIFNLSNSVTKPVTHKTGTNIMLVNDFVFWNCKSEQELNETLKYVNDILIKL